VTINSFNHRSLKSPASVKGSIKVTNAIPLTIFSVIISLAVFIIQDQLSNQVKQPIVVYIAEDDDRLEDETHDSENGKIDNSDEVLQAADFIEPLLFNKSIEAKDILTQNHIKSLSSDQQKAVLAHLIKRAFDSKQFNLVLSMLSQLQEDDIAIFELNFEYAKSLSEIEQYQSAIDRYQLLLKSEPAHQTATVNLGLLLLKNKKYEQVKQLYSNAIGYTTGTKKAKVYAGLGDVEYAYKNYKQAIEYYQKSIEYRPSHKLTWKKLARAHKHNGSEYKVINEQYTKAVDMDITNYRLLAEYGTYLYENLQFKKAIPLLKKSLSMDKESIKTRLILISCYIEDGQTLLAQKQVEIFKKYVETERYLTMIKAFEFYIAEDYRSALNAHKSLLKANRDNNFSYYQIGLSYIRLKKSRSGIVYFKKMDADSPYYNLAQYYVTIGYVRSNQLDLAETKLNELMTRLPNANQIAYQVAELAYKRNKTDLALFAIDESLTLTPNNRKYHLLKAKIEWKSSRKDQAFKTLEAIVNSDPQFTAAIYVLADYREQSGDNKQAMTNYEKILDIDREYSDTLYRYAALKFDQNKEQMLVKELLEEFLQLQSGHIPARILYTRYFCDTGQRNNCSDQIKLLNRLAGDDKHVMELNKRYLEQQ